MAIDTLNSGSISFKKLSGKSHTQQNFAVTEEGITTTVQGSFTTIFSSIIEPLPVTNSGLTTLYSTNGVIERVKFEIEIIPDTEISLGTSQGYRLKLPADYNANGELFPLYSGGTYLHATIGKLQIVPSLYGTLKVDGTTEYDPILYQTNGTTVIPKYDPINWYLDTYNGILFIQNPPAGYDSNAARPGYLEAFLYVGNYLEDLLYNIGTGATGTTMVNVGGGVGVWKDSFLNTHNFKSFVGVGEIGISGDTDNIIISYNPSTGVTSVTGATNGLTVVGRDVILGGNITGQTSLLVNTNTNASLKISGQNFGIGPRGITISSNYPNYGSAFGNGGINSSIDDGTNLLLFGSFTHYKNEVVRNNMIKINPLTSSIITSFNFFSNYGIFHDSMDVFSNGKFVGVGLGSVFYPYSGIIRYESDGYIDRTFSAVTTGFDAEVDKVKVISGDSFLVSGGFGSYNSITTNIGIQKFNYDGTIDTTFNNGNVGVNDGITGIIDFVIQTNGKIVFCGPIAYDSNYIGFVGRLNSDGTFDNTFNSSVGFDFDVYNVLKFSDDNILFFNITATEYNGVPIGSVVKVDSDGNLDMTFRSNVSGKTYILCKIDNNDKILCVEDGTFILSRLNSDGTIDTTFQEGIFDGVPNHINTFNDDHIIVTGSFTGYNDIPQSGILLLDYSGNTISSSSKMTINETISGLYQITTPTNIYDNTILTNAQVKETFEGNNGLTLKTYDDKSLKPSFEIGGKINRNTTLNVDGNLKLFGNITLGSDYTSGLKVEHYDKFYSTYYMKDLLIHGLNLYSVGEKNPIESYGSFFKYTYDDGKIITDSFETSLGSDTYETVAVVGGEIYLGGSFITYNGEINSRMVKVSAITGLKINDFDIGFGFNNAVYDIATNLSEDKIYVGGLFTTFNNVSQNKLVRLNLDGTIDTTFNIGTGFGTVLGVNAVRVITIQTDGKVLVGGGFNTYTGSTNNRLIRLNTDGTKDSTFNIGTGFSGGLNPTVRDIIQLADNTILVGGAFTSFTGSSAAGLIKLNSNGTKDTTFNIGSGFNTASIYSLALQGDGKIVVGGSFTTFTGSSNSRIIRLNSNGSKDSTFNTGTGFNDIVYKVLIQPDGKILAAGRFTTYNGVSRKYIARLNSDGSLDSETTTNQLYVKNGTIEYGADYSSQYTLRSLVDVEYVTGLTSSLVNSILVVNGTGATLTNSNDVVLVNTSGATTITLPSGPSNSKEFYIKDKTGNASTNAITIAGNGKNIDGSSSGLINTNYGGVRMIFSTTENAWFVIGTAIY